jgi:hypothetical protein
MALWYDCGNGHAKAQWARKDMGCDAYLFCPGPSLANYDSKINEMIKQPGIMSFAINTAYPTVKPDVWIGMDRVECYDYKLWWEPFPKVIRGGYQDMHCEGFPISKCPNVFAADVEGVNQQSELFKRRQHDVKFVWHKNTLAVALHIMVWMGAKKIHLVGCDLKGTEYCDGRQTPKDHEQVNARLYKEQQEYLRWFAKEGKMHGVELISCTSESPINDFLDFVPLSYAAGNSTKTPKTFKKSKLIHAVDAEDLYKAKTYDTMFDDAVDVDELFSSTVDDNPLIVETPLEADTDMREIFIPKSELAIPELNEDK